MDMQTSDIISLVALIASGASAYYAKSQRDQSIGGNSLAYRQSLAEHHQKYSALLDDLKRANKPTYSSLSSKAGRTLDSITSMLDQYDLKRGSTRPLRHILGEAAEMIGFAFNGQLGWQTHVNLSSRLTTFLHVEDRLEPSEKLIDGQNFRRAFERRYFEDPNQHEETCLKADKAFCCLVQELQDRIDGDRRGELLLELTSLSKDFKAHYDDQREALSAAAGRLASEMEANASEQFHLSESGLLLEKMRFEMHRLSTLSNFYFPNIDAETAWKYLNYTSVCIYVCAVLDIIQRLHSWGWDNSVR